MFAEIHDYFEKVKGELEAGFKGEQKALVADVETAIADTKLQVLKDVAASAPDIQAAVQKALNVLEQAALAAIASHLV